MYKGYQLWHAWLFFFLGSLVATIVETPKYYSIKECLLFLFFGVVLSGVYLLACPYFYRNKQRKRLLYGIPVLCGVLFTFFVMGYLSDDKQIKIFAATSGSMFIFFLYEFISEKRSKSEGNTDNPNASPDQTE